MLHGTKIVCFAFLFSTIYVGCSASGSGPHASSTTGGAAGTSVVVPTTNTGGASGSASSTGGAAIDTTAPGGLGPSIGDVNSRPDPSKLDGGCKDVASKGELLPLDIFIMFDQSQSMDCAVPSGGSRWQAVTTALTNFVNDPGAKGIGVGIQYFGLGGLFALAASCNVSDYAGADVPIAPLPGNAQPIIDSLGRHKPSTNTPSQPALEGAIQTATAWKQKNPSHTVITLLITDGQPNACAVADGGSLVEPVVAVAARGLAQAEKMNTYVIGITSGTATCATDPAPPNKADLDRVAAAGGSTEAIMIDLDATATQKFIAALNKIRAGAQAACTYSLPAPDDGAKLDPAKVNVGVTNTLGGTSSVIYRVNDDTACDPSMGGWHYDNEAMPTKILLCPASCTSVGAAGTIVNIKFGCQSSLRPPA
ncbi:MAG TPA: vWA domain-containing protein [Polyangiaceae bacterium]|jgi:hypothetical protein|nr:vWA domain-containing protein [Polyangiaceae bacterium]